MELWRTRHEAIEILSGEYKQQSRAIERAFQLIDQCIDLFDKKAEEDEYHRVCGIALAKARHLALGVYGLVLDGLGQESGALMRPLIEYHELLVYFRTDPSRVQQVINGNLPSAGKIAQLIEGDLYDFRKYLNEHASHSSFSQYSIMHLLDASQMKIRSNQPMISEVLFQNMSDLFVQLVLLIIEAIKGLQITEMDYADKQANDVMTLREFGIKTFALKKESLVDMRTEDARFWSE